MTFSDQSYNLRIELDSQGCELSPSELEEIEEDLDTLGQMVEDFPVSDLHITVVYHKRSDDYHVKTSLALSGRKLFTGERHAKFHPAFERCVRKLTKKVRAYKHEMRVGAEAAKQAAGTEQELEPAGMIDLGGLREAVEANDYPAFRRQIDTFEPSLIERVGRWLERYPQLRSQLDPEITVSDIIEEVFLNAFDRFAERSHEVPPGPWLESLIDPSIQALLQFPDEEFARVSFSQSTFAD